jgi:hypothetical protein
VATLNTQQKAPLNITDFVGQPVSATGALITLSPASGILQSGNVNGTYWLTAIAAGICTVTVAKGGSVGTLEVEVVAAPLTLTLGTPEPK